MRVPSLSFPVFLVGCLACVKHPNGAIFTDCYSLN
uniref:Uncharacterized protein n=1 Tax=Populus trichocarpa TaxID=3694 RepID=A9PCV5_POPTR|nr:unknown [Populus trichocarpa]